MGTSGQGELVLSLAIEHLKEFGQWPKLEHLHQRIHQDLHLRADVQEAARRLAPMPFVGGGYSSLSETFAPPIDVIATSAEGQRLLGHVVAVVNLAREKYETSHGQPEVTNAEVEISLGIDPATARAVRELLHAVPWVTDGGMSNAERWSVTVAHNVTRWEGLRNVADLLGRLAEIRERDERHLAALALAQTAMRTVPVSSNAAGGQVTWRNRWDRAAEYLEGHPLVRIIAVVAVPVGIVAGIVALIRA